VPTQRTAELAEYQIYIVSPVVASALLKIDVDLALLARKTKQAPLAGARRAVLEKTRTFPVRDAKLAPQALDLMDDEPRMSKETLAGRGQRDTTAIVRASGGLSKLLLHSTNAGDAAVEACNDSGGCTEISSCGQRRRGMPANPDDAFGFYLLSDAPDGEEFLRLRAKQC
jgi:hypothetical protein